MTIRNGLARIRRSDAYQICASILDEHGIKYDVELRSRHAQLIFQIGGVVRRYTLNSHSSSFRTPATASADIRRLIREADRPPKNQAAEGGASCHTEPPPAMSHTLEMEETVDSLLPEPTGDLVYNGYPILDRDEMLSLTHMWRAGGSPDSRRPVDWVRTDAAGEFIEYVGENLKVASAHLWISEPGRHGGGTWAHWQIAMAYAKYISPEFHAWCNSVVRIYMESHRQKNDPIAALANSPKSEILLLAAQIAEQKEKLERDIAAMRPLVEAHKRLADADGTFCMTDAAKVLQVQPKALIEFLSQRGWIYRRHGNEGWLGYQSRVQDGFLIHKVSTQPRSDGSNRVFEQVRVTAKGLSKLAKCLQQANAVTFSQEAHSV